MIVDIVPLIDILIEEFPNDVKLQQKLGVVSPGEESLDSFQSVLWPEESLEGISHDLICETAVKDLGFTGPDDLEKKRLLDEMLLKANRLMMLKLLERSSDFMLSDLGITKEEVRIYLRILTDSYRPRMYEIVDQLSTNEIRRLEEIDKLEKMLR